jgi:choline dehydrogenase-like flavoprotein
MLADLRTLPNEVVITSDLCVIGAGAAGISIALALRGQSIQVCLVEAGGFGIEPGSQGLMTGDNVGFPYFRLDEVRTTGFGGTTSVWAGACRPLDSVDLEPRDWVPYSGWPIGRAELDPFYVRAQKICQIGPYAYAADDWDADRIGRLPLAEDQVETHVFQVSSTRFGHAYRHEILGAPNITTLLHAHAVEIETNADGTCATGVRLSTLEGKSGRVQARAFILAMGGIENARMLLLSRGAITRGLGNQHDLVGRFFMEHLYLNSGELVLRNPQKYSSFYSVHSVMRGQPPTRIEANLSIADAAAARNTMLRSGMHFPARWLTLPAYDSDAVQALNHLVREVRLGSLPYNWAGRVRRVARGINHVGNIVRMRLSESRTAQRTFAVRSISEQAPDPNSRVILSHERDRLGRNKVRLDWRLNDLDLHTISAAHRIVGQAVAAAGVGHLRTILDEDGRWRNAITGGRHHMGTTRMSDNSSSGVVDANCRVHGLDNLFVAGSSVFPTGGYANPTLTIVALALRLADHVKSRLQE